MYLIFLLLAAFVCCDARVDSPKSATQLLEQIQELEDRVEALEDIVVKLMGKIEAQVVETEDLHAKLNKKLDENNHLTGQQVKHNSTSSAQHNKNRQSQEVKPNTFTSQKRQFEAIEQQFARKNYTEVSKMSESFLHNFATSPNAAMVHFWLGEIRMIYGDHVQAKDHYTNALALDPKHEKAADISLKLAVIAYEGGLTEEADNMIKNLMKMYPKSSAAHLAMLQKKRYHATSR